MRQHRRVTSVPPAGWLKSLAAALLVVLAGGTQAPAQTTSFDELLSAIVRLKTYIHPDGRTVRNLGRQRDGSAIVIDDNGLILTIGYLMVEARAAEVITNDGRTVAANVVGYDHDTGFGLLRASGPLKLKPLVIGKSAEIKVGDPVLAASHGGRSGIAPALIAAKREFAGNWEYLLDETFFTAPAHSDWSGAALISREGKLVGVGALIVSDATGKGDGVAGNMYVPIDLLAPILSDLIAEGRTSGPQRPWLGVTMNEIAGRLFVAQVTPEGPAEKAGLQRGDVVVAVNGQAPKNLADFYRKVWAMGRAGAVIPLDVLQNNGVRRVDIHSMNRLDHLKLRTTF